MSEQHQMRDVDEAILEHLRREQPEYIPFVANRLGMQFDYVDGRCDLLARRDLIERVTGEPVYCLTDRGERYLRDGVPSSDRGADGP